MTNERLVAQELVNGYLVSTVRLSIPYSDGSSYETLIVANEELMQFRYSSRLAAEAGHDQAREHAKDLPTFQRG